MGHKVKIVHVVEGFAGGIVTYIDNVLTRMVEQGLDVSFVCSVGNIDSRSYEVIEKLRKIGVKVYIIKMEKGLFVASDVWALVSLLRIFLKGKFDIVHSHCSKAGALGRVAGLLAGIRIRIYSPHCFSFVRCGGVFRKWVYVFIEKVLGCITSKFIFVGKEEEVIFNQYRIGATSNCAVVENGLDKDVVRYSELQKRDIRESFGIKDGVKVVATVCRLVKYKGVIRFVEAMGMLEKEDVVGVVAGAGKFRDRIEGRIKELRLESKVRLLGDVKEINKVYSVCEMVLLCSDGEGQSYVILEAMRNGCVVGASDVAGNRELIGNNRGVLFERKARDIARCIDGLIDDGGRREEIRARAYEYFCKGHGAEMQVDRLRRIYEDCLRQRGSLDGREN